ncbi:hypothetical protein ZWY2020_017234 [Hordeum vulgare]|nr:hypothetical protein ZWY2020_017234 [Hordeum vulgare]
MQLDSHDREQARDSKICIFFHGREQAIYNPKLCSDRYSLLRVLQPLRQDLLDLVCSGWLCRMLPMDVNTSTSFHLSILCGLLHGQLWRGAVNWMGSNSSFNNFGVRECEETVEIGFSGHGSLIFWDLNSLFKTVFDLMLSVTLFIGRFEMRKMQTAMNRNPNESKRSELLHNHLDEKDEVRLDLISHTGDGGNSTYVIARFLAQPSLVIKSDDSGLIFSDGELLGGDLGYQNPCSFTYVQRFSPF